MLKKRLIPCLLLKNGRCVKGVQFKNFRDTGNPVTAARIYENQGADELIFLDITATVERREPYYKLIQNVADQCFMPITFGGGIREVEHIRKFLLAGADKVSINSAAVEKPELIREGARIFGKQCIIVSIDAKKTDRGYEVYTHSGTRATGLDVFEWAKKAAELGAGELLITSIDNEGTRKGYDLEVIRKVSDSVGIPVIASGGAGTLQHLVDGITIGGASAVSAASIFHFTDQSPIKAKAFMKTAGIDVRTFEWWKWPSPCSQSPLLSYLPFCLHFQ